MTQFASRVNSHVLQERHSTPKTSPHLPKSPAWAHSARLHRSGLLAHAVSTPTVAVSEAEDSTDIRTAGVATLSPVHPPIQLFALQYSVPSSFRAHVYWSLRQRLGSTRDRSHVGVSCEYQSFQIAARVLDVVGFFCRGSLPCPHPGPSLQPSMSSSWDDKHTVEPPRTALLARVRCGCRSGTLFAAVQCIVELCSP